MVAGYDIKHAKQLRYNQQYEDLIKYIYMFVDTDAEAMCDMALCYYNGQGVEKDDKSCFDFYKKAADLGNSNALAEVGYCFRWAIGIEKDISHAIRLYEESIEQGSAAGQAYLGKCYEYGTEVEKNEKKAVELYRKSAEQGNAEGQWYLGQCYEYGVGVEKNEKKAVELYRESAEQGNAERQWYLGQCYENGIGIEKNEKKAVELYRKSAERGNAKGQQYLGQCYENGIGIEKNEEKAVELYKKSSEQGNEFGQWDLARCYENGIGIGKNEKKAIELYSKMAECGDENGQWLLGDRYNDGRGVEKDEKKAAELFRKSAEQGNEYGQMRLGECYLFGTGVEEDVKKAVELFGKSAEQGNEHGQMRLGECYLFGAGVEKDEKKAAELFRKSAEQGNQHGQLYLGKLYFNGIGIGKNKEKAVELFQKAAIQGNDKALLYLGSCYYNGDGVEQNQKQAVELYTKSSEQGNSEAKLRLAICYRNGQGVEKDEEKAIELFQLAAEQGESDAQLILGELFCRFKTRDEKKAIEYYQMAINNSTTEKVEVAFAYLKLGDLYSEDIIIQAKMANEMYIKAANMFEVLGMEEEDAEAYYWLGNLYEKGKGVDKDLIKAFKYYSYANQKAYLELGQCYENGIGTVKNLKKAVKFYELAIQNQNYYALVYLGRCYEYGRGVSKNVMKAVSLYNQALEALEENENVNAVLHLGMCYYHGKGIGKNEDKAYELFSIYKDNLEIAQYYCKVIKNSDIEAMYKLGNIFEGDFYHDDIRAFQFYSMSAKAGYIPAIIRLVRCYHLGKGVKRNKEIAHRILWGISEENRTANIVFCFGIEAYYGFFARKDLKAAVTYFKEAAKNGDMNAAFFLSICYRKGKGLPKDKDAELYWLAKSVDIGCRYAVAYRGLLYLCNAKTDDTKEKGLKLLGELVKKDVYYGQLLHATEIIYEKANYNERKKAYLLLLDMIEYKFINSYTDHKNIPQLLIIFTRFILRIYRFLYWESKPTIHQEFNELRREVMNLLDNNTNVRDESMKNLFIDKEYDFFISHASEDKNTIVEPLVNKLTEKGANVWYDKKILKIGDSLRESIDLGLAHSKYGIVILSEQYFRKFWTGQELNGMFARQEEGKKVILPIWHNISKDVVKRYSPMLADMVALKSSDYTIDELVENLLQLLK